MKNEMIARDEALQKIAEQWQAWPREPRLADVDCAALPGWVWQPTYNQASVVLVSRNHCALEIAESDWQQARDEFLSDQRMDAIGQNGNDGEHYHHIELPSARRPLVDVLLVWLKEWPSNGGTEPCVFHATDGTVTFRNLSDDHSWYAYREADGATCYWPEWYSAGRAEGLPVVAPVPGAGMIELHAEHPPETVTITRTLIDDDYADTPLARFYDAASDPAHDYNSLASVLLMAFDQAAAGKGKDRHAQARPFDCQPMQTICHLVGSHDGLAYQAIKKIQESQRLEHDHAVAELMGAIVYTAGNILFREANRNG